MDPFFFEPSTLNIHTKYNITVEPRQLAFKYGINNPERSVHDGTEENDNMLIFEECNHKICGSMVHLIVATVESIPNDSYSIQVIIMIVTSCIRFPANI